MDSAAQLPAFLCLAEAVASDLRDAPCGGGRGGGIDLRCFVAAAVFENFRIYSGRAFLSSGGGFVCADRHVLSSARFSVVRVFRDDGGIYNIFEKYAFSGCIFRKNVL